MVMAVAGGLLGVVTSSSAATSIALLNDRYLVLQTGIDNYEWNHGYDVSFGLIDRQRPARASARILAAEASP